MRSTVSRCILVASVPLAALFPASAWAQQAPAPGLRDVVDPARAAPRPPAPDEAAEQAAPPPPQPDPMTILFKRVSQLMMVTLEGVNGPAAADRQLLATLTPGAIVLPRVTTAESTAAYVRSLRPLSGAAHEGLPFIIGVDLFAQEKFAGDARVSTVLRVPMMLSLAAAGPSDATAGAFGVMADNLHSMGFDFHLGPSLALSGTAGLDGGNPLNTFGEDPQVCAGLARQFDEALKSRGLAWMPIGYPGGAGRPAILLTPRSQLRNRDLAPYVGVVNAGTRLLNVGVALVPTIDGATPACFSPIVISDLRGEVLGYDGLVIAGPMDAPEIKALGKPEEAVVEALLAGADMFYWSTPGPGVTKAIAAVVNGVQKGALDDALIERALTRVREYKKALPEPQKDKDVAGAAKKFGKKQEKLTEPLAIERRAITLVRNNSNVLPLSKDLSQPIAVVAVYGAEELKIALEEYIKPIAQRSMPNARQAPRIEDFELNRIVKLTDSYRTVVCVISGDLETSSQQKLIRAFRRLGKRIVAVVLGYPRDISALDEADAVLITYGSTKRLGDTMTAVADVLVGNAPVDVLPPLRNLTLRAGEVVNFDVNDVLRSPVGRLPVSFAPPYIAGYSVSYRPTLALESVHWDFGDGAKSSAPLAAHTFKKPGDYVVTLTIKGPKKEGASGAFQVQVQ